MKISFPLFLFLAWRPSWLEVGITGHTFGRGLSKDHSTKVWSKLAKWILRRKFKCEKLTTGETWWQKPLARWAKNRFFLYKKKIEFLISRNHLLISKRKDDVSMRTYVSISSQARPKYRYCGWNYFILLISDWCHIVFIPCPWMWKGQIDLSMYVCTFGFEFCFENYISMTLYF